MSANVFCPENQQNYTLTVVPTSETATTMSGNWADPPDCYAGTFSLTCANLFYIDGILAPSYITSLQAAYDSTSVKLEIIGKSFTAANLQLNQNKTVELSGGYNCGFLSNAYFTAVQGSMTIRGGKVTVEKLIIK
jgi:hypothetical protein